MQAERNPTLSREDKARLLSKHVVITVENETAMCPSFTDPNKMYHINIREGSCDCPDNTFRGVNCMHMQAVDFKVLSEKIQNQNIKEMDAVCNDLQIAKIPAKQENKVLKKIFDSVGIENTQALIRKDLLLDHDTKKVLEEYDNKTRICECGCGFEVGSEGFQNIHVEDPEEEILQGMSYQEWCEECNPTYEQLAKLEQLQRRDY